MPIDGHFWIEMPDGSIVDYIPEWATNTMKLMEVSDPLYIEAPMRVQARMIKDNVERKLLEYEAVGLKKENIEEVMGLRDGFCHVNVIINQLKNPEGVIKFGSFGWRNKKTGKSYLEFDWKLNDEKAEKRGPHPFQRKMEQIKRSMQD